jgi:N-acetylglutamate synthase-like GNAT family acetyltransferase
MAVANCKASHNPSSEEACGQPTYYMLATAAALLLAMSRHRIDWKIRPASARDSSAIQELLETSYRELLPSNYDESLLCAGLPLITKPSEELMTCGTWYVALHPDSEQILGCGGWTKRSPTSTKSPPLELEEEGLPHLRHFACHPESTRMGTASMIWQRTLHDIADAFGKIPALEVYSTLTAIPFYQSLGFQNSNALEIPLNQGECMFPAMLMTRQLEELRLH